jgi:hypothetical protein
MPEFTVEGLNELREATEKLHELALRAAVPAMEKAVLYLHGRLPDYPLAETVIPDGVSFLRTDAQRAFFFANVRKGNIPGWHEVNGHAERFGSGRTGTLGRKETTWTYRSDQNGDEVIGKIGTNLEYAPWVVGPDFPGEMINGQQMYQAKVHVDRWWQFAEEITDNMPEAWKEFDKVFADEYQKLLQQELGG